MWLDKLTALYMTPLGWMGRKTSRQTNKRFMTLCIQCLLRSAIQINVKKIAFGNKEHTTDKKMEVLVLLRLFISSSKISNNAYAL